MNSRLKLHEELVELLGSRNVYYQPPESVSMSYPAIVYSKLQIGNKFANNNVYAQSHSYRIIVIDSDPDSIIMEKMSFFKTARFERHYAANGLNHFVFGIVYKI